ncbi:hypothetical protein RchiOBHm_Chr4g0413321 [Rosa chinensis]|uniref:Uncharacterized protein n=1 Tax=Rosa chinensis TaxID=74649 RepID=A0A2P6QW29_ROSCH|nr:hypothetical protein RchiOBHm_Chr4g0413321 [Rosa chinensis]
MTSGGMAMAFSRPIVVATMLCWSGRITVVAWLWRIWADHGSNMARRFRGGLQWLGFGSVVGGAAMIVCATSGCWRWCFGLQSTFSVGLDLDPFSWASNLGWGVLP